MRALVVTLALLLGIGCSSNRACRTDLTSTTGCPATFDGSQATSCSFYGSQTVRSCPSGQVVLELSTGYVGLTCIYSTGKLVGTIEWSDTNSYCGGTSTSLAAGAAPDCPQTASARALPCADGGTAD
jgi:hypothetical protein